jgi:uracil-DNA glycosylase
MQVKIDPTWQKVLQSEFDQPYFEELSSKVKQEYLTANVFPEPGNIFRAFDLVPFDKVKVLILGQDPYHTPGVADGLSFSTKPSNRVPPSLQNIYKEILAEFDIQNYPFLKNPDLTRWAEQGVLLINNTLTVRSGEPNSHSKYGWEKFTDRVIEIIAKESESVVFILWGNFARGKKELILRNSDKHLILESPHPSPFSAHNGFFGNGHFKACNEWLIKNDLAPVNW